MEWRVTWGRECQGLESVMGWRVSWSREWRGAESVMGYIVSWSKECHGLESVVGPDWPRGELCSQGTRQGLKGLKGL